MTPQSATVSTKPYGLKDVFLSYGRRESMGFVARLHQQLLLMGHDCWFDKVNIPDGDDYQQRIAHGIDSAHNFVFVMSPHSLASPHCLVELEYARLLGKRIIPVNHVYSESAPGTELPASGMATLQGFYGHHGLPDPQIATYRQVRERALAIVGPIDWLDAREEVDEEACAQLLAWAQGYENEWHRHGNPDFLKGLAIPGFGRPVASLESVLGRLIAVLEREKSYVEAHTRLLLQAQEWAANQKQNKYLLVGQERKQAEDWLLQPFNGERRPPCTPTDLHCDYICQGRKNAENLMTDVFLCGSNEHQNIRRQVVRSLSRYAVTCWSHERDIRKGEDYEAAILRGIEEADSFLVFLSPATLTSAHCQREYLHAHRLNKHIIPVLLEPVDEALYSEAAFPGLRVLQYVDFTDNTKESDYGRDIDEILHILKEEEDYFREHKKLLAKALKWKRGQGQAVFLLRGFNLENAHTWLRINRDRAQYGPTDLHREFIAASEAVKGSLPTEVFISYSRKDSDFARKLNNALQEAGKTTWFDQESIATGADFQAELYKGIEAADNFVFVISPDSVRSPYCRDEVAFAKEQGKRCFTLLHRATPTGELPTELSGIQWLDFEKGSFGPCLQELLQALDTDRGHARRHTVLQQRALEWDEQQRHPDFLLNAAACKGAGEWLENAGGRNPAPTPLQHAYITASQQAVAAAEAEQQRVAQELEDRLQLAETRRAEAEQARLNLEVEQEKLKKALKVSKANEVFAKAQNLLGKDPTIAFNLMLWANDGLEGKNEFVKQTLYETYDRFPLSRTFKVGSDGVTSVAFSPDGQRVLTGFDDGTARLWNLEGKDLAFYRVFPIQMYSYYRRTTLVAFSPDGQSVLTNGENGGILWDLAGSELRAFQENGLVTSIAFSPDGQRVLMGNSEGTAKMLDLSGKLLQTFKGLDKKAVTSVAFSPMGQKVPEVKNFMTFFKETFSSHEGQRVLTGSADGTSKLWALSGKLLQTFEAHGNEEGLHPLSVSVAFSPDAQRVLTASNRGTAKLWDLAGNKLQDFENHIGVTSIAFSPDGNHILTTGKDQNALFWEVDGTLLHTFPMGHPLTSSAISPDGQKVLIGSEDGSAKLWAMGFKVLQAYEHKGAAPVAMDFSPDGRGVLTGNADGTVKLWDPGENGPQVFKIYAPGVESIVFSPDGQRVLTGSKDGSAKLWDIKSNAVQAVDGFEPVGLHGGVKFAFSFSHDGQGIIRIRRGDGSTVDDPYVENEFILCGINGKVRHAFKWRHGWATSFAISPDGQSILIGQELYQVERYLREIWPSKGGNAILLSMKGEQRQEFKVHDSVVTSVAFSPDGQQVLIGNKDGAIGLWELGGNMVQAFNGHKGGILSVAFSPDGKKVLTCSQDGTAKLWNLLGNTLYTFGESRKDILSVTFSPDGQQVLTRSRDGNVKLWQSKMTLEDFLEKGNFDRLTEGQKKEYGLLGVE